MPSVLEAKKIIQLQRARAREFGIAMHEFRNERGLISVVEARLSATGDRVTFRIDGVSARADEVLFDLASPKPTKYDANR